MRLILEPKSTKRDCLPGIFVLLTRLIKTCSDRGSHDPCAVLAVTHPDLFEFVSMHVDVETEGDLTRGMTVFDQRRTRRGKATPNCKVATHIDQGAARELLLKTL